MKKDKQNIGIHSNVAFDEEEAVDILSKFLKNGRKIRTFFTTNDKTPNQDGYFELCDNEIGEPTKQFIVQIKKAENLKPENSGKNKGKYKYSLETKFLNCVKNRVFESPAIYFVVDIKTNNIFWVYLSDKKLINMEIGNKDHITYYFSQNEICTNIDDFIRCLNEIVKKRNQLFFTEDSKVITEVQNAIEYLNGLLNWDLKFVKNLMFKDIWRFGISYSNKEVCNLIINDENISNEAIGFSIYAQKQGEKDFGYRKEGVLIDIENMFKQIDTTNSTTPEKYAKDVMSQILQQFFNSHLIIEIMPEIIITEILGSFIIKLEELYNIKFSNSLSEIETVFINFIMYVNKILSDDNLSKEEKSFKSRLLEEISHINNMPFMPYRIDLLEEIVNYDCKDVFDVFCKKLIKTDLESYQDYSILDYLSTEYSKYYLAIKRAKKLKIETIDMTNKYEKLSFNYDSKKDKHNKVREFCKKWFKDLVNTYIQVYNDIFRDKKYFNYGYFEYEIQKPAIKDVCCKFIKYKSNDFNIKEYKSDIDISKIDISGDIIGNGYSLNLINFIQDETPLYHSVKCLLYQGIAKELQIQCKGIKFNNSDNTIFNF